MEWIGNHAFMRIERVYNTPDLQKCIALEMDPTAGTFACSIYETRPEVCRELARGSSACRGEIATKGERPKRALVLLGRARG